MDNKLPIDFEEKVKLPPPANGIGYPYRISAKDLMKDFVFSSPIIEEVTPSGSKNGITVTETTGQGGNKARKLSCTFVPEGKADGSLLNWFSNKWQAIIPIITGGLFYWNGMKWAQTPPPTAGSMLYYDGVEWVMLNPPTADGSALYVISYDSTDSQPYWRDIASMI